jgi:hypothetical protein
MSPDERAPRQPTPVECDYVLDDPGLAGLDRGSRALDAEAVIDRVDEDDLEAVPCVAVLPGSGARRICKGAVDPRILSRR